MTSYLKPYVNTTQEAQDIIRRLDEAAINLCSAIAANDEAQAKLRDAEKILAGAESEIIFDEGIKPDGKLKGIATTSKMYAHAIETLTWRAKQYGGTLFEKALAVRDAADEASKAATTLAQAQTMYGALKHIADLKGRILAAGG